MEKEKKIFNVSLDSLMSEPIEVESANDIAYPDELLAPRPTQIREEKEQKPAPKDDEEKDLIDLEDTEETEKEEEEEEESEDIQQEDTSSKTLPPQKQKQKTSSPLTPYAKLLVDEGVLPNLDVEAFDGTAESLKDAMIEEILGAVDMYKESLPERVKHLINNYEDGVSFEKLLDLDKIETDISSIDEDKLEEDVSTQKKIVTDYLKRTTKFTDTKISKLVDGYEDSGDLEDEAKSALGELKTLVNTEKEREKTETARQKKEAEAQRQNELRALQEKVKNAKEIIPGMSLNDKIRNNVFASMTTPVGYDQSGRPVNRIVAARMDNPVEFEMKLHYLFEMTKGFTDFSKLTQKGRVDASKSFEEAVKQLDEKEMEDTTEKKVLGRKSMDFLKGLEKTYKL